MVTVELKIAQRCIFFSRLTEKEAGLLAAFISGDGYY